MENVRLNDKRASIVDTYPKCKSGISLRDTNPALYNARYKTAEAKRIHDGNFAFVTTALSKLHEKVYEPKMNTNYAKDIPIDVGGGMVDFVDFFTIDYIGMPTPEKNLVGNNVNVVERINGKLNHKAAKVFNFEMAYDINFIEIDKLDKVNFTKSLETIYKDGILAGWDLLVDKIAYEGTGDVYGLLNHPDVKVSVVPQGTFAPTKDGLAAMTDSEVVGLINGILSYYLINSNNNLSLLPDVILLPQNDATEMSSRFSQLYTDTLRGFLMQHNVGIDEAKASGDDEYKVSFRGRSRLNGAGSLSGGRIVAYKYDKDFVRLDIPYPVQVYYTGPNTERGCYTTFFVGQVSQIQLPYNETNTQIGGVSYWDLTPGSNA